VTGRWEHTPTVVPILERIAAIEDSSGDLVEYSDVTPADLIPDPGEYRIGPGDQLLITLYDDIDNRGLPSTYERIVDIRGTVDLPQLGQISLSNRTVEQAKGALVQALSRFVNEPLVAIVVTSQRQQTFNVMGIVEQPGPYFISKPDYRLLEALTAAGRFPETTEAIFIIRQIPLSDTVRGVVPAPDSARPAEPASPTIPTEAPAEPPKDGAKLIDLIDQLSQPAGDSTAPATPNADPKRPSPGVMRPESSPSARRARPQGQPPADQASPPKTDQPPPVDLVDPAGSKPAESGPNGRKAAPGSSWVFVHGEWVQIKNPGGAPAPLKTAVSEPSGADQLMTQRVIRVPVKPLIAGLSQYNMVVRPGDVIHVPPPPQGYVYMTGQIVRPGPYTLPEAGKLTLTRAMAAAGGLSAIAIPERVDLVRVVGKNKQAIIRLDFRAIQEGTMPDIYMRPDDVVNVGTNFWAYPLAVLRNGIRTSYGFGFVVDRNFDNQVFGYQDPFGN